MKDNYLMDNLERTILNNLQTGDEKAFEYIFQSYFRRLFNYAHDLLHSNFVAEEIVADVFTKLWENRTQIHVETSIKAYLFRAVYNQCVSHVRQNKVEDKYKAYFTYYFTEAFSSGSDYPLEKLLTSELETKITEITNSLPEQCRNMFLLSRQKGLSHEEIAQKYNVSVNTVHTQISRALKKFREELKNYFPVFLLMLHFTNKY